MKKLITHLLLVTFFGLCLPASAHMVKGRIIEDLQITEQEESVDIKVIFRFPIRYLGHFPEKNGSTLQIRLKELSVSREDKKLLEHRDSVRLPKTELIPLLDVSFEGDLPGGPYLTLRFREPISFQVSQDADFRSLRISILSDQRD